MRYDEFHNEFITKFGFNPIRAFSVSVRKTQNVMDGRMDGRMEKATPMSHSNFVDVGQNVTPTIPVTTKYVKWVSNSSTVGLKPDQSNKEHQSSASLTLCEGNPPVNNEMWKTCQLRDLTTYET